MKKLFISKNEGVAEITERIISEEDFDIVLVVPRGAGLGDSASNFHLIKRESDAAKKNITVESVDDAILSLAKASQLEAVHPLFEGSPARRSAFSDIVPLEPDKKGEGVKLTVKKKKADAQEKPKKEAATVRVSKEEPAREEAVFSREPESRFDTAEKEKKFKIRLPGRKMVIVAATLVFLVFAGWFLGGPFAKATVTINFEKTPWEYEGIILVDTSVSKSVPEKNILPAELFVTSKNLTHLFPASAVEEVEQKARGKIWIYNAFSSAQQTLVATTRFETPDGKTFRIIENVTVPGAEIKDGKIIPSSIEVDMVADKPGEAYNIGPITRLSIPGFKGTPRYQGFYGEIKKQVSGGFIGKKPVPTADDIKKAREKTEELLRTGLETTFISAYPKEYKILDGASRVDVPRLTVNQETDNKGNFSVFGEAKMSTFGFREEDLRALLEVMANKTESGTTFKELALEYSNIKPDFGKGALSFNVSSKGEVWPKFSPDEFKNSVLGKRVSEAQSLIAALPGFSGGKVALWPIWLRSVPSDPGKVEIVVE